MWILVFYPWRVYASTKGLIVFVIYHFLFYFCLSSWHMAIFTNPGRVPDGWKGIYYVCQWILF
jgi:hypothetical protein